MHAARVHAGLDDPSEVTLAKDDNDKRKMLELQWFQSQPAKTKITKKTINAPQAPSSSGPPHMLHRQVNIRDIADDLRDQNIYMLAPDDVGPLIANWRKETGKKKDPPEEQEPSAGQLAYLSMCSKSGENPYVNIAFWGPFGDRIMRRILQIMWMQMPDGTQKRQIFLGPQCVQQWLMCWMVFECGMIMFGLADYDVLEAYRTFIIDLANQWGPKYWAIIYQADARMRRTGLESLRRIAVQLLEDAVKAEQNGQRLYVPRGALNPYDFNPKKPWNHCYRMAIHEHSAHARQFRKRQVERPCTMIMTRSDDINTYLDADAAICSQPGQHIATGGLAFDTSGLVAPQQPVGVTRPPKVKQQPIAGVLVQPDIKVAKDTGKKAQANGKGIYKTNNKGVTICPAFNNSSCSKKCPSGHAHQCNKCLKNNHTGPQCKGKDSKK